MFQVSSKHWPFLQELFWNPDDGTFLFRRVAADGGEEWSQPFKLLSEAALTHNFNRLIFKKKSLTS